MNHTVFAGFDFEVDIGFYGLVRLLKRGKSGGGSCLGLRRLAPVVARRPSGRLEVAIMGTELASRA